MADELRDSLVILSERGEPAGAETVLQRARGELAPVKPASASRKRPLGWRRGLLAAAASAVGVLLVIGIVWLAEPFSGTEPSQPVATVAPVEPSTPPPAIEEPPVVAPEPPQVVDDPVVETPTLGAASVAWTRLDDATGALGGEGDQFLQAVVEGGPGFVAVGAECPGHCPMLTADGRPSVGLGLDDWTAAVWVSADGASWDRVEGDEALFGGEGDQVMMDVVAGGPGLVAVGWTDHGFFTGGMTDRFGDYPEEVGLLDGEVWVSSDGIAWERVSDPTGAFTGPGNQRIEAVVVGGPGLVAVGFESRNPEGMNLSAQAAIWTSADGYIWEQASLDGGDLGPLATMLHDVAAGEQGLIAVGRDMSLYVDNPPPPNPGPQSFYPVPTVPGDPTRQKSYESAAVWASTDGVAWERVDPYSAVFGGMPESHPDAYSIDGGPIRMVSVAAYGGGFIAAGPGEWDRGIWLSADGYTWQRVDDDDPVWGEWRGEGRDLAVHGGRVVWVDVLSEDGDFWDDETRRFGPIGWASFYVEMAHVIVERDSLLAVGSAMNPAGDFDAAVWVGAWDG